MIMLMPVYTKKFEKDISLAVRRGMDMEKLKLVIRKILEQQKMDESYRNHMLVGNYTGRYECHIQPDWLLIYKLNQNEVIFERTGSHSDLFKSFPTRSSWPSLS